MGLRYGLLAILTLCSCSSADPPTQPQASPVAARQRLRINVDPPPPLEPAPDTETPKPQPVDDDLQPGFALRAPVREGRLTVVPIVLTTTGPERGFVTLARGMSDGVVRVTDGQGIEHVMVTNTAQVPLAILGGEVLLDGHQDRVVARSVTVPAKSSRKVLVHCAELGRGSGGEVFRPSFALAEPGLRAIAAGGDQLDVWTRIDAINARNGLNPPTQTYRWSAQRHTSPQNIARRDRILAELDDLADRDRMVGFAAAVDGKVIAVEQMATPALYNQLEAIVLASYLPASSGTPRATPAVEPAAVRTFVKRRPLGRGTTTLLR